MTLGTLEHPIVLAPMGGGPATPELAAAVSEAGGLGFLAAGYLDPEDVRAQIRAVRELTERPFGVNIFVPSEPADDREAIARYAERIGADPADAVYDDDEFCAKLGVVADEHVPVVSFTFGCPSACVVRELHRCKAEVWVTVTTPGEARAAAELHADALVVQGVEAGGHRGGDGDVGLLALLQLVAANVDLPLIAAGGIATGSGVAAVLAAGARAGAVGSAFMLADEAGTGAAQRRVLRDPARRTVITRAFTGRDARGIENRFIRDHDEAAPAGYPEVHNLTAPLRAAAREREDADGINLWAGQAYPLARPAPAAEIVRRLSEDARTALAESARRFAPAAPRP